MLLRYVALHGVPVSEDDWAKFRAWRSAQIAAPHCDICAPEVPPPHSCEGCTREDCPLVRHGPRRP